MPYSALSSSMISLTLTAPSIPPAPCCSITSSVVVVHKVVVVTHKQNKTKGKETTTKTKWKECLEFECNTISKHKSVTDCVSHTTEWSLTTKYSFTGTPRDTLSLSLSLCQRACVCSESSLQQHTLKWEQGDIHSSVLPSGLRINFKRSEHCACNGHSTAWHRVTTGRSPSFLPSYKHTPNYVRIPSKKLKRKQVSKGLEAFLPFSAPHL